MELTEIDYVYIDGEVTQHPYRTARVTDAFMVVERSRRTTDLELELVSRAKANPNNHVVYAVTDPGSSVRIVFDHIEVRGDNGALYVWFHDTNLHFGHTIEEGTW